MAAMTTSDTSRSSTATRPASTWKRTARKDSYIPATAKVTSVSAAATTPSQT